MPCRHVSFGVGVRPKYRTPERSVPNTGRVINKSISNATKAFEHRKVLKICQLPDSLFRPAGIEASKERFEMIQHRLQSHGEAFFNLSGAAGYAVQLSKAENARSSTLVVISAVFHVIYAIGFHIWHSLDDREGTKKGQCLPLEDQTCHNHP